MYTGVCDRVRRLILFILVVVLFSTSVFAVNNITVTGVTVEFGDYAGTNGDYTYVGTNNNGHNYWVKEAGASDYYVYYENGFDGWIIVYESSSEHAIAGDSPNSPNYFVRGLTYGADAAGTYDGSGGDIDGQTATAAFQQGGGDPESVPEFSTYAIIFLMLTVVSGFVFVKKRHED